MLLLLKLGQSPHACDSVGERSAPSLTGFGASMPVLAFLGDRWRLTRREDVDYQVREYATAHYEF